MKSRINIFRYIENENAISYIYKQIVVMIVNKYYEKFSSPGLTYILTV